jgi:hypothetical protein
MEKPFDFAQGRPSAGWALRNLDNLRFNAKLDLKWLENQEKVN